MIKIAAAAVAFVVMGSAQAGWSQTKHKDAFTGHTKVSHQIVSENAQRVGTYGTKHHATILVEQGVARLVFDSGVELNAFGTRASCYPKERCQAMIKVDGQMHIVDVYNDKHGNYLNDKAIVAKLLTAKRIDMRLHFYAMEGAQFFTF